jgi:hypothetical protein
MIFWAIDPGEAVGWAYLEDGVPKEFKELMIEDFYRFIWAQPPPERIIMEDYLIRPPQSGGYHHEWGRVPTIQVIGAVKCYAVVNNLPVVLQQPQILVAASARFKMPHPKNKSLPQRNAISAILHGRWWWYREGAKLMSSN